MSGARTIPAIVQAAAERYGNKLAIRDDRRAITFQELNTAMMEAAGAFLRAGVRRGEYIGIWAPNCFEWIVAATAAQAAGAAIVPLSTRARGIETASLLSRCRIRTLICVGTFLGTDYPYLLAPYLKDLSDLERLIVIGDNATSLDAITIVPWESFTESNAPQDKVRLADRMAALSDMDVADVLFTSGTTGRPKGVPLTHGQTIDTYSIYGRSMGLSSSDESIIVNPFFHAFGYKAGWVVSLVFGVTIQPVAVFNPVDIARRISATRATVLTGTPSMFKSILAIPAAERGDLSSLHIGLTGGSSIPPALIEQMRSELGFDVVFTAYGLTEASALVSMTAADDPVETVAFTVGKPIARTDVIIRNSEEKNVGPAHPGEILVRGPQVMNGYLDDESATREAFTPDGWLRTGDVGHIDRSGNLVVTDRIKDMFICGGFNCYPAEIENLLLQHPAIRAVGVVGIPEERLGEVCSAFVVLDEKDSVDVESLTTWARASMSNYKVPRRWWFVDDLPQTALGKVQRAELRLWASERLEEGNESKRIGG